MTATSPPTATASTTCSRSTRRTRPIRRSRSGCHRSSPRPSAIASPTQESLGLVWAAGRRRRRQPGADVRVPPPTVQLLLALWRRHAGRLHLQDDALEQSHRGIATGRLIHQTARHLRRARWLLDGRSRREPRRRAHRSGESLTILGAISNRRDLRRFRRLVRPRPAAPIDRWGPAAGCQPSSSRPGRARYVDSTPYDHTSILKFIEWRWGLAPLQPETRSPGICCPRLTLGRPRALESATPVSVGHRHRLLCPHVPDRKIVTFRGQHWSVTRSTAHWRHSLTPCGGANDISPPRGADPGTR